MVILPITLPGTFPERVLTITTIKDLAKYLNISVSTVSRALNNHHDVNQTTRENVLQAVEKLNYRPNSVARSLIHKKTYTIGLMVPDIADPFFSSIAVGVEQTLSNNGYQVIYGNTSRDSLKEKQFLESILDRKVDGVILTPNILDQESISTLEKLEIPRVLLRRRTPALLDIPFIDVDHYGGACKAINHLISKGHTNIGFLGMASDSFTSNERLRGYLDTMKKHQLKVSARNQKTAGRTIESGSFAMEALYRESPDITAVFASNDLIGIGALEWLKMEQINVPEQMAVIGFDNLEMSELYSFQLTTIAQPRKQMGQLAAELLLRIINEEENKDSIILETNLIERKTC
ncbi:LacI family DNA-binding transcriptional regulator [Oceanobacillus indicireducens]|uniref:LacI family DNA-binding transcriptional regulator n=1 Tax=Oceanobacillus indicireducens TaxID=1004261 RepID=UPI0016681A69|nr:LacI family DNA-binding transcriptional regulator [Oceanobacillus indicireducens]